MELSSKKKHTTEPQLSLTKKEQEFQISSCVAKQFLLCVSQACPAYKMNTNRHKLQKNVLAAPFENIFTSLAFRLQHSCVRPEQPQRKQTHKTTIVPQGTLWCQLQTNWFLAQFEFQCPFSKCPFSTQVFSLFHQIYNILLRCSYFMFLQSSF